MDARRAVKVAEKLERAFNSVTVRAARWPITVHGTEHKRIKYRPAVCPHNIHLIANNVTAWIDKGYLRGPQGFAEANVIPFSQIIYCQRCEFVISRVVDLERMGGTRTPKSEVPKMSVQQLLMIASMIRG